MAEIPNRFHTFISKFNLRWIAESNFLEWTLSIASMSIIGVGITYLKFGGNIECKSKIYSKDRIIEWLFTRKQTIRIVK